MATKKYNYGIIQLTTDKKPKLIKLENKELSLEMMYEYCGCDVITIATTADYNKIFGTDYALVCDDMGLLRDKPIFNPIATFMYSFPEMLAGDCIVCRHDRKNEEPDVYAIPIDECKELYAVLCSTFEFLNILYGEKQ